MSNLEQLTELQAQLGYAGAVHPIALLGLMGEAGEVAAAADYFTPKAKSVMEPCYPALKKHVLAFVDEARCLDTMKKQLRQKTEIHLAIRPDEKEFDEELADVFYYVNAVALGRGISLEELAARSLAKVARKRGGGMPPELLTQKIEIPEYLLEQVRRIEVVIISGSEEDYYKVNFYYPISMLYNVELKFRHTISNFIQIRDGWVKDVLQNRHTFYSKAFTPSEAAEVLRNATWVPTAAQPNPETLAFVLAVLDEAVRYQKANQTLS